MSSRTWNNLLLIPVFRFNFFLWGRKKITSGIFSKNRLEGGVWPLSQKIPDFFWLFFVPKKFRFMIPIIIHTLPLRHIFQLMPVKNFLCFFVDPNFTWLLGLGIHFYYFSGGSGGRSPPEIFGGFSGWFFNIFVSVKSFFAFLGGVWGRSSHKIFEIFHFSDAGGAGLPRIFSDFFLTFWCLKKIDGVGSEENFFLT